jgi:hypothetical protein
MHRTTSLRRLRSKRGSVLLATILAAIILSMLVIGLLDWSINSLRATFRKRAIAEAKEYASNELETLFYHWSNRVAQPSSKAIEARLKELTLNGNNVVVDDANIGTTYSASSVSYVGASGNDLDIDTGRSLLSLSTSGVGVYRVPGQPAKKSAVGYYRAKVRTVFTHPVFGPIEVRMGRRFVLQQSSPFNFAVFYNGDLELNPGTKMVINGDVQCNNSVFIGGMSGADVIIAGNVYYHDNFNGASDTTGAQNHKYVTAKAPTFDRNPDDASVPDQAAQRLIQLKKMTNRESYISGVDPSSIYNQFASLSERPYDTVNDVNRAIIAPPPKRTDGSAMPENPIVSSNRIYNKACLRIEVKEVAGTPVATFYDANGNDVSGSFSSVATSVRATVYDSREQMDVKMTTIDIAQLKSAINANSTLKESYNGVIYVHDPAQQTDSTQKYGIRLATATEVPNFNGQGFTVASDNGLYIQGSYNTVTQTVTGSETPETARCAVLADAVTLLSEGWDDTKSTLTTLERKASADTVINTAVISGNTPSASSSQNSGGAQNLVRYMEDWTGRKSVINGSLGQMYQAKYFNSYIRGKDASGNPLVYVLPDVRFLTFDQRLAERPPPGAPSSVTNYYRGDLFTWQ